MTISTVDSTWNAPKSTSIQPAPTQEMDKVEIVCLDLFNANQQV